MDDSTRFAALMGQLEDWYADPTKARAYDTSAGPGARDDGHRILHKGRYPQSVFWRSMWARTAPIHTRDGTVDTAARAEILEALEEEIYGLDHGPSRSGPASGLHHGTREWRLAIASADGSLRAVARRFGVSHTEVRRLRLQHPEVR